MRRILLVGDERKGRARALIEEARAFARQRGLDVEIEMDRDAPLHDRNADLVVVFGGDGSLLAAARRMGPHQMPTLGINLGRLGFLTAFGDDRAIDGMRMALEGELVEEPRLMLLSHIERADGSCTPPIPCLNDAVLTRRSAAGMIRIVAARADRELATYSGDGVIVATPVGSTAYSLAAGGPILSPRLDALVLTPLASHSISLRPLVVPVGDGVYLSVLDTGSAETCTLVVDGQVSLDVRVGERVHALPAPFRFRHLTRGAGSFFEILREKFGWADEPRRRNGRGDAGA
jgi:NAD+ kinase